MNYNKKYILSLLFIMIFFVVDIITKHFVFLKDIKTQSSLIYILPAKNYGSAFGLFSSISWYAEVILVFSFVILGMLLWEFFKKKELHQGIIRWFFILFIAGLLGNTIDRLIFGYVRDFIGLHGFAIFNVADCYLVIATILGCWLIARDLYHSFSSKKKAKF